MGERELGRAVAILALHPAALRLEREELAERELREREHRAEVERRLRSRSDELGSLPTPRPVYVGAVLRDLFENFGDYVFGLVVLIVVAFIAGAIVQGVLPGNNETLPLMAVILVLLAPPAILVASRYSEYNEELRAYEAKRDELQRQIAEDTATLAEAAPEEPAEDGDGGQALGGHLHA